MRKTIIWTIALAGGAGLALLFCIATRSHEIFWSETCEGTVAQIQPSEKTDAELPKSYLVELRTDDPELHVFSSTDWRWSMVSPGDRVRARLLCTLPWSKSEGRWQDGVLMSKFLRPPTLADSDLLQVRPDFGVPQVRPDSRAIQLPLPKRDKKKNLGGLGNLALSILMFCWLWRRHNAPQAQRQPMPRANACRLPSVTVPTDRPSDPLLPAGGATYAGSDSAGHRLAA